MPDRKIDPEIERDLAALDAAVHGSPDAEPALATLVADVRAARPVADPIFLARLEEEVAAGFGRAGRSGHRRRWLPPLRITAPLGAAAMAATVAAIALSSGGSTPPAGVEPSVAGSAQAQRSDTAAGSAAGDAATAESQAASGAPQRDAVPAASAPAAPTSASPGRKVERAAALTLATGRGKLQATADRIASATTRLGGYVAASSISVSGDTGSGQIRLRVPSARLDEALAELGRLAHVRSLDRSSVDVTGGYNATAAALEEARAERRGLLAALAGATDEGRIARLKVRLRENAARLAGADAAMTQMRARTERATIDVRLETERRGEAPVAKEPRFGIGAAARTAVNVLSAAAGVLLLIVAGGLPLLLATFAALIVRRSLRRRDRERALQRSAPSPAA